MKLKKKKAQPVSRFSEIIAEFSVFLFQSLSLNPVQVLKRGAEEEKAETARMVS